MHTRTQQKMTQELQKEVDELKDQLQEQMNRNKALEQNFNQEIHQLKEMLKDKLANKEQENSAGLVSSKSNASNFRLPLPKTETFQGSISEDTTGWWQSFEATCMIANVDYEQRVLMLQVYLIGFARTVFERFISQPDNQALKDSENYKELFEAVKT